MAKQKGNQGKKGDDNDDNNTETGNNNDDSKDKNNNSDSKDYNNDKENKESENNLNKKTYIPVGAKKIGFFPVDSNELNSKHRHTDTKIARLQQILAGNVLHPGLGGRPKKFVTKRTHGLHGSKGVMQMFDNDSNNKNNENKNNDIDNDTINNNSNDIVNAQLSKVTGPQKKRKKRKKKKLIID